MSRRRGGPRSSAWAALPWRPRSDGRICCPLALASCQPTWCCSHSCQSALRRFCLGIEGGDVRLAFLTDTEEPGNLLQALCPLTCDVLARGQHLAHRCESSATLIDVVRQDLRDRSQG